LWLSHCRGLGNKPSYNRFSCAASVTIADISTRQQHRIRPSLLEACCAACPALSLGILGFEAKDGGDRCDLLDLFIHDREGPINSYWRPGSLAQAVPTRIAKMSDTGGPQAP